MSKATDAADRAMRSIDAAAAPGAMTEEEALEFYEALATDISARLDGLRANLGQSG